MGSPQPHLRRPRQEIASIPGRKSRRISTGDKRTVQRWERLEAMPVHRHQHDKQGTVDAIKSELDEWWKGHRVRIEREEQTAKTNVLLWSKPQIYVGFRRVAAAFS